MMWSLWFSGGGELFCPGINILKGNQNPTAPCEGNQLLCVLDERLTPSSLVLGKSGLSDAHRAGQFGLREVQRSSNVAEVRHAFILELLFAKRNRNSNCIDATRSGI